MRAVVIREHGDLDALRLEDLDPPAPGPGEVQVELRAAGVNHLDTWVRRGVPGHRFPLPIVPGCDGAGIVADVGAGVTRPAVGDEVVLAPGVSCGSCAACSEGRDNLCRAYGILGETRDGTDTERIVVPAANCLPKPKELSFPEAAAIPLVFLTAWTMVVERAGVRPGDVVLVQAAGSGVGSAALQVARLLGATVIATASTDAKRRRALELGAEHAVDSSSPEWGRQVHEITARQGVDVAIEHVGEPTFAGSLRALKKGGRLVTCGATAGSQVSLDLKLVFFKNLSILGSTMGSRGSLHRILQLAASNRLKAVVDRVLPLDAVREAHRLLADREVFGKLVLVP